MLATMTQYLVPFLLVLSVVVFVHEFGHYWVARRNGVRIEVFSIGFGPELFGRNDRHGTRWKFSAVPLGGYVKMLGDADAASATVDLSHAPRSGQLPVQDRLAAHGDRGRGPDGELRLRHRRAGHPVRRGRPAVHAAGGRRRCSRTARPRPPGLLPGDRITAVDGQPIESFEQLQANVFDSEGRPLPSTVDRGGETVELTVTPTIQGDTDRFGTQRQVWRIGVSRPGVEYRRSNPFLALFEATAETGRMIGGTLHALGEMVVGKRGTQELGGPLRIAQMSGQIAQDGFVPALWFTAVLSINLGLINLFPIPMLDGGHLAMYGIEAVRGRPLNERSQEIAFRFGLAMVLSLMVFATWNDVVQFGWVERLLNLIS